MIYAEEGRLELVLPGPDIFAVNSPYRPPTEIVDYFIFVCSSSFRVVFCLDARSTGY